MSNGTLLKLSKQYYNIFTILLSAYHTLAHNVVQNIVWTLCKVCFILYSMTSASCVSS